MTWRRIAAVICCLNLALLTASCGRDEDEQARNASIAALEAAIASSSTEPVEAGHEVAGLPYPIEDLEDQEFVNQLETVNKQLLLPLAITVPKKVPINMRPEVVVGGEYSLQPNEKWIAKMSTEVATLFHEDGIAVQLTMCKTDGKFEVEAITKQLKVFYDSFIEKGEVAYKDVFLDDRLSGQEVSFVIEHDGQDMYICVGALSSSKKVAIYTVNYFIPETGNSVVLEQVNNLLATFTMNGKQVIRK